MPLTREPIAAATPTESRLLTGAPKEYHVDYDHDQVAELLDQLIDGIEALEVTA